MSVAAMDALNQKWNAIFPHCPFVNRHGILCGQARSLPIGNNFQNPMCRSHISRWKAHPSYLEYVQDKQQYKQVYQAECKQCEIDLLTSLQQLQDRRAQCQSEQEVIDCDDKIEEMKQGLDTLRTVMNVMQ